jgi:hypothetical protein
MCDAAGSIEIDFELASFQIGETITISDLDAFSDRIVLLESGRYWIVGFIDFQYGRLSKDCKAHGPVFKAIAERGIPYQVGYVIGYNIPTKTRQRQDKDKDKTDLASKGGVGGTQVLDKSDSIHEQQQPTGKHSVAVMMVEEFRQAMSARDGAYRMDDRARLRAITDMESMLTQDGYTPEYIRSESRRLNRSGKAITTVGLLRRAINERWSTNDD